MSEELTAEEQAARTKVLQDQFVKDHEGEGIRPVGRVEPDGEYGHPFHDRVAAYIKDPAGQRRLQTAFMEGFSGHQQDTAIAYLRGKGIIDANTPTARINEFLVGLGIAPLTTPGQVMNTMRAKDEEPVNVGEVTLVSPDKDDEIIDAEIIEDDNDGA